MIKFLRDMFIGWIIYTDSGKKTANMIVNYTYTQIKKNLTNNSPKTNKTIKKDINEKFINRTKDRLNIERNNDKQ